MKLFSAPNVAAGSVVVVEDGRVVADGPLAALVRDAGPEPEDTEIYVNPADVESFRARWFTSGNA
jgi:cephalosporin hydroxylase